MRVKVIRGSADMLNDRLIDMSEYEDEYEVIEDMKTYMIVHNLRTNNTYSFKKERLMSIEK